MPVAFEAMISYFYRDRPLADGSAKLANNGMPPEAGAGNE